MPKQILKHLFLSILLLTIACKQEPFNLYLKVESVTDLQTEAPVEFRGVKIGEVEHIETLDSFAIVLCTIDTHLTNIPANSIYALAYRDILEAKFIDIRAENALPPYLKNGDTLSREVHVSLLADSSGFKDLMYMVDSLAGKMKEVSREYKKRIK